MVEDANVDEGYVFVARDSVPAPSHRPNVSHEELVANIGTWLQPTKFLSPGNDFMKHLRSYAPGTGKWVQESPIFRASVDDNNNPSDSCLHIRGVAGSGKSVLSANTIHQLERSGSVVLFFFFRQIVDKNHSARYLVRDFAAQLLPHCPALVKSLAMLSEKHAIHGCEMKLVWPAIVSSLVQEDTLQKVYCVVDGLDEMDNGDFDEMVQRLVTLGTTKPEKIRVMATSRPLPHIDLALRMSSVKQLKLDLAFLSPDVARYVDTSMAMLKPTLSEDKHDLVKQTICSHSSGLFLHARLLLDNLIEGLQD